ncbi:MAG: hypothetical protein J6W24_02670 [Prevotella sp.]|nr:hypothetical protein [Prevotella sp.]
MKKIFALFLLTFTLSFASNAVAQTSPIEIVTGHPDLNIKVKRCAASGNTVILDMIFTNTGTQDADFEIWGSYASNSEFYDDEGNSYHGNDLWGKATVKFANAPKYDASAENKKLLAGVPTKVSFKITDVPVSAQNIALVELGIKSQVFDMNLYNKKTQLRNIPITRK